MKRKTFPCSWLLESKSLLRPPLPLGSPCLLLTCPPGGLLSSHGLSRPQAQVVPHHPGSSLLGAPSPEPQKGPPQSGQLSLPGGFRILMPDAVSFSECSVPPGLTAGPRRSTALCVLLTAITPASQPGPSGCPRAQRTCHRASGGPSRVSQTPRAQSCPVNAPIPQAPC